MSAEKLDQVLREARDELGTAEVEGLDWERIDRGVFARIEAAQRAEVTERAPTRRRLWTLGAASAVAAAAFAVLAARSEDTHSLDVAQVVAEEQVGTLTAVDSGQALVAGHPASVGAVLRLGETLEARGARVTVERADKLVFVAEPSARAVATRVRGGVVLALEAGAVEAQVAAASSGEAFAVDIGRARVAVHGTHLRVWRLGDRVIVDLSEGVVTVGDAPRVGATLGALVTAPAHVEFRADDAQRTLQVSHDPATVRPPAAILVSSQPAPIPVESPGVRPPTPDPNGIFPVAPARRRDAHPAASASAAASTTEPAQATSAPLGPDATIAAAVRACMTAHPHARDVTVVMSTTLDVEVGDDGVVRSARFEPPVPSDVNGCASPTIYKTRFAHAGTVTIPLDVKVPSSTP